MTASPVSYLRMARNMVAFVLFLAAAHGVFIAYFLPRIMPMRVKSVHAKMVSIGAREQSDSGTIIAAAWPVKFPVIYINAPDQQTSIHLSVGVKGYADFVITRDSAGWPIRIGNVTLDMRPTLRLTDPITSRKAWALSVDASGLPVIEEKTP